MNRNGSFVAWALTVAVTSCGGDREAATSVPTSTCSPDSEDGGTVAPEKRDLLSPARLLARASFVLRGTAPTDEELDALLSAGDQTAQLAFVDRFVDTTLGDPIFYRTMFELARDWLNVPLVPNDADAPEYGPEQQRALTRCDATTARAGAWHYYRDDYGVSCSGKKKDGTPVDEITVEPWWAPGTEVKLVGAAASTSAKGSTLSQGNPITIDCNGRPEGTCGCGPHAVGCHADQGYAGWPAYVSWNPDGHRRLLSEEPARLFAHIAWFDRPATDLIANSYSVGPTRTQAAYVNQGIAGGVLSLLEDDSWWRPARYDGAPVDPFHKAGDPAGWREFQVPKLNPFILADRNYTFDPRIEKGPMKGTPAAGMLTGLGFLDALPRERLRAARALENLACEVLAPPIALKFNEYRRDPATEGPCQHCHMRIDPAAIHFKRWAKHGGAFEGWGASYYQPGIGTAWHWPKSWRTGAYPYGGDPFSHWNRWYVHDTAMTPVKQPPIDENPEVVFIDFLPPDQTLLGQKSDGTVGPLGFAKMIIAAGAFDRCLVRKLHGQVLGRDLDPAREAGYLDALTKMFVDAGRKIRPFVKELTRSELFRRGR